MHTIVVPQQYAPADALPRFRLSQFLAGLMTTPLAEYPYAPRDRLLKAD